MRVIFSTFFKVEKIKFLKVEKNYSKKKFRDNGAIKTLSLNSHLAKLTSPKTNVFGRDYMFVCVRKKKTAIVLFVHAILLQRAKITPRCNIK